MKNILEQFKKKKNIIIIIIIVFVITVILLFSYNSKKYNIYLELYMTDNSYGYKKYIPGNKSEFYLYKNSFLDMEYSFSDNKIRKVEYIISDDDILEIKNDKVYAKNVGETKIYIKSKDNIKSNVINIKVVDSYE